MAIEMVALNNTTKPSHCNVDGKIKTLWLLEGKDEKNPKKLRHEGVNSNNDESELLLVTIIRIRSVWGSV